MFDPATFQSRDGAFVSRSVDGYSLSPVYTLAVAARRVTEAGSGAPTLHNGYGHATFDRLAWLTGEYSIDVRITVRQASELAEIGERLLQNHCGELKLREIDVIESLMRFVRVAETVKEASDAV